MEVREGYKQTEVGIIPEDWDIQSYDELFSFLSTATYSRSQLSRHEKVQYLHYGDIHTKYDHHIDFSKHRLPSISDELVKSYAKLKDGDIVMADASEDYSGICKSIEVLNIEDKQAIAGLHTFLLRDTSESFVNGFRGYISSSSILKQQYDQYATGMKVYGVSKTNLKKILIPIPPKPEQKAIAKALSDVDTLIASIEQLIEKKRLIKQGAMQELLTGKRRLPGFEVKKGYKQTELGEIPEDWEATKMGDVIAKIIGGGTPSRAKSEYWGNEIPWITVKDFATFNPNIAQEYITKKGLENSSSHLIPKGILITSTRMAIGKAVIYNVPVCINQDLKALFPNIAIDTKFLYYWFENNAKTLEELGSGSTVKGLSLSDLKKVLLSLPSKQEQQAIATILSDMDSEIEALEAKLQKTRETKEGMMHELLTGRIRFI